jgi:hypothetical protein
LLIGPHHNLQRPGGGDAGIVQAADHLQRSQHAHAAIKTPTGRRAVQMAAHHHRCCLRVQPFAPGKQIADGIAIHAHSRLVTPVGQHARGKVLCRQGQPLHTTIGSGTYRCHGHQAVP